MVDPSPSQTSANDDVTTTTSNVTPVRSIEGLAAVTSEVMREAIVRATTEICNTEPKNRNLTAHVHTAGRTTSAVLVLKGLMRVGKRAVDPVQWILSPAERAAIVGVAFNTVSNTLNVRLSSARLADRMQPPSSSSARQKAGCGDEPQNGASRLKIALGYSDNGGGASKCFIPVNVSCLPTIQREVALVASWIAANVAANCRRRGSVSANVALRRSPGNGIAPYYVVETNGLVEFDARALDTDCWDGSIPDHITRSLAMQYDAAAGVHRIRFDVGIATKDLVNYVVSKCTEAKLDPGRATYGFDIAYDRSVLSASRKRVEVATVPPQEALNPLGQQGGGDAITRSQSPPPVLPEDHATTAAEGGSSTKKNDGVRKTPRSVGPTSTTTTATMNQVDRKRVKPPPPSGLDLPIQEDLVDAEDDSDTSPRNVDRTAKRRKIGESATSGEV